MSSTRANQRTFDRAMTLLTALLGLVIVGGLLAWIWAASTAE